MPFQIVNVYPQEQITIMGAGATFPYPLIDTWSLEYEKLNPDLDIDYQAIGSGGGLQKLIERSIDFGATDAPLTPQEVIDAGDPVVHVPETIGSVAIVYNIPSVSQSSPDIKLNLSGQVLADIYLGNIKKWNDKNITNINPGVELPDESINVVHRADSSGTTFVLTDYLSSTSSQWNEQIGKGKAVTWPIGSGADRNEGVSSLVSGTENSIGYVELAYSVAAGLEHANIENQDGNFVEPTIESVNAAAESRVSDLPQTGNESWNNVTLVNSPGENSYPISSYSYLVLYQDLSTIPNMNQKKSQELVDFISWVINEGQKYSPELSYVPLSDKVVEINNKTLQSLSFNGEPVI
jgi:phosphate transport system substrate-binding protein